MAVQEPFINIVLLGKTGNGKSSTANSILGREAFKGSCSSQSVTKVCTLECSEREGTKIRIVDTPGLMDTTDLTKTTLEEIGDAMSLCSAGFHAIIFVVKFGSRFTKEEQKVFEILKDFFGQDILKKFGIIIISQGDSFYLNNKQNLTFKEWLAITKSNEKESVFVKLLDECEERCVLFYNSGDIFEKKKEESVSELLELIKKIPEPYTNDNFKNAEDQRNKLIKQLNAPALCAKIQENLSMLLGQLDKDIKNKAFSFDKMNTSFKDLENELDKLNCDTSEFKHLKSQIKVQQDILETMKNSQQDVEKQNQQQKEMMRKIEALKNPPSRWDVISKGIFAGLSTVGKLFGTVATFGLAKGALDVVEEKAYQSYDLAQKDFLKSVDARK